MEPRPPRSPPLHSIRTCIAAGGAPLPRPILSLLGWALAALLVAPLASAQIGLFPDEFERSDVISIEPTRSNSSDSTRRQAHAPNFDSRSRRRSSSWRRVADRPRLDRSPRSALSPGSGFREVRFQSSEVVPVRGLVEDQVALIVTSKRTSDSWWARAMDRGATLAE